MAKQIARYQVMNGLETTVRDFVERIKGYGFTVYLAERGQYGFITDATEQRVLSFSFTDGGSLGGNYGPPSTSSGTGWRMEQTPYDLQSAEQVRAALYAHSPEWTKQRGVGWKHYTTVEQHLALYGSSSRYTRV